MLQVQDGSVGGQCPRQMRPEGTHWPPFALGLLSTQPLSTGRSGAYKRGAGFALWLPPNPRPCVRWHRYSLCPTHPGAGSPPMWTQHKGGCLSPYNDSFFLADDADAHHRQDTAMMGIGWSEMLLIGIMAIILLDPADIPTVLRTLGRITAKTRSLSQELMQTLDEVSQEAHRPPSGRAPFSQGTQPSQDAGPSLPPPAAPTKGRPSSPVRPPRPGRLRRGRRPI